MFIYIETAMIKYFAVCAGVFASIAQAFGVPVLRKNRDRPGRNCKELHAPSQRYVRAISIKCKSVRKLSARMNFPLAMILNLQSFDQYRSIVYCIFLHISNRSLLNIVIILMNRPTPKSILELIDCDE